jgi:hypothetical protein
MYTRLKGIENDRWIRTTIYLATGQSLAWFRYGTDGRSQAVFVCPDIAPNGTIVSRGFIAHMIKQIRSACRKAR